MAKPTEFEKQLRAASPLLTVRETAIVLRATVCWVRRLIASGALPHQRQGKSHLVLRADLNDYIQACRVPGHRQNVGKTTSQVAQSKHP
jgi:excisionase family DNA binding protein